MGSDYIGGSLDDLTLPEGGMEVPDIDKLLRQEQVKKRVLAQQAARRNGFPEEVAAPPGNNGGGNGGANGGGNKDGQGDGRAAPAMGHGPVAVPANPFAQQIATHNNAYANMMKATNAAFAQENASRLRQAEAERSRQHEIELESMRLQAVQEQQQAAKQQQTQLDQVRQARNRSLLGAAGLGGHTIQTDGKGNRSFSPHPFGTSPFGRALLG